VGPQAVARKARAVGQLERLAEELGGRRDRGELVAAAPEPVEDLGPIDVGETAGLGDLPGAPEQLERCLELAEVHPCPGLGEEGAKPELS
jgi:hypothetical protein